MLIQVGRNVLPQRVQYELHALASREFCRGYEISVSGNKDDDIRLSLQCNPGNINADPHINALLAERCGEIVVRQVLRTNLARKQVGLGTWLQNPRAFARFPDIAQTNGQIALAV